MSRSLPRHSFFIRRLWIPTSLTPLRFVRWGSLSAKRRDDNPMPSEAADYWKSIIDDIGSPTAQILRDQLDMGDVTGLPKDMSKKPANLDFHTEVKKAYPEKLVVVQNGKFYETLGHDAVLFVNECGLMPMALYAGTPTAGFPVSNLQKMRQRMVDQLQYSMVVCDQFKHPEDSQSISRRIVAIYNPGESTGEEPEPMPTSSLVSLNWTSDGYQLSAFRRDRSTLEVTNGMTEDAMWGWISSTSICAPICLHHDFLYRVPDWKRKIRSVASHIANRTQHLQGHARDAFLAFIQRHYGYDNVDAIHVMELEKESGTRRCPSFYTAAQLGMTGANGIPNLLDFVVPPSSLKPVKAWLKDLLLVPRPMEATVAVRMALEMIAALTDSVPPLRTYLSPGAVTKAFEDGVPTVTLLRKLHALLSDVTMMFETEQLRQLGSVIVHIVEMDEHRSIQCDAFLASCQAMMSDIQEVVVLESQTGVTETEDEDVMSTPKDVLNKLFSRCESFHGIVHNHHIHDILHETHLAKAQLTTAVYDFLDRVSTFAEGIPNAVSLAFDGMNAAVHFLFGFKLMEHSEITSLGLIHPHRSLTRKNSKPHYSSVEVEAALEAYKSKCEEAHQKVQSVLLMLRDRLDRPVVISACAFGLALQSLMEHSWMAQSHNWHLPILKDDKPLSIQGMWPYWMKPDDPSTVANDLELKDMVLLTAPNMAGKSTVLRSVAAVGMLAMSGLYVPAVSVECPYVDHIVLRSFSGDHPLDRHSGFSMEMAEMKLAVHHTTHQSLILIDELGKGTEVKMGSAISGSLLEHFAAKQCMGIFSTHLHFLKKMPLETQSITWMKMNTYAIEPDEEEDEASPLEQLHVPEWRVTPGANLLSLAIQSAWKCGLERHVIARSCLYEAFLTNGFPESMAPLMASPVTSSKADSKAIISDDQQAHDATDVEMENALNMQSDVERIHTRQENDHSSVTSTTQWITKSQEKISEAQSVANFGDHMRDDHSVHTEALPESTAQDDWKDGVSDPTHSLQCNKKTPEGTQMSTDDFSRVASNGRDVCPSNGRTSKTDVRSLEPEQTTVEDILTGFCLANDIVDDLCQPPKVHHVKEGHSPPPATAQRSYVYITRRSCGHHYVGETDNLRATLTKRHMTRRLKGDFSKKFEAWYMHIPKKHGAKSGSRRLETQIQKAMIKAGFLMEPQYDTAHTAFGVKD